MGEMSNFGQQHLQRGRMLDSDLISDLSSPNQRSCILPSIFGGRKGGGEHIKPHLEVIICIFKPWTKTLRCSSIIQNQAPTARQTQDASPPPHKERGEVNEPLQMYVSSVGICVARRGRKLGSGCHIFVPDGSFPAPHSSLPPSG
jgi:hypothetical protein